MKLIKKILAYLFNRELKDVWPESHSLDNQRSVVEDGSFKEVKDNSVIAIPDPEFILGPGGSKWVNWDHKDDLFVNFAVTEALVVENIDFMMRYIHNKLTSAEREIAPASYHQCFADISEVVSANLNFNMQQIENDRYCFIVGIGDTIGLLLLRIEDSIDIIRRSTGIVKDEKAERYHMQFMRFHPEAIKLIGPCSDVKDWPGANPALELVVNFATFEEETLDPSPN